MEFIKSILKSKGALVALIILSSIYLLIIFASFFSPYSYDADDINYLYAPPTKLYLFSFKDKVFRPFIYGYKVRINEYYQRIYQQDKNKIYPLKFFVSGFSYKFLGFIPTNRHFFGVDNHKVFLMGADYKGRDIFSRILYGGRISLSIGVIASLLSLFIGVIFGSISGYYSGKVDIVLMRLCELLMMIPGFYLMLTLRAIFPLQLSSSQIYFLIVIILSLIGWTSTARVIRGMAISLRQRDFVYAAKAQGLSDLKIIFCHIIPHTFSYALVAIVLSIPAYILGEAVLSLVGLGIQEPIPSWGNLLSESMGIVVIRLYPWILIPGLWIIITVICFNIIGERLREVSDPRIEDSK